MCVRCRMAKCIKLMLAALEGNRGEQPKEKSNEIFNSNIVPTSQGLVSINNVNY